MVLGDLAALQSHTIRSALARIVAACSVGSKLSVQEEKDICGAGVQIHQSDFEVALSRLQSAHADSIGAPKVDKKLSSKHCLQRCKFSRVLQNSFFFFTFVSVPCPCLCAGRII